jgi:hypothetical protein
LGLYEEEFKAAFLKEYEHQQKAILEARNLL